MCDSHKVLKAIGLALDFAQLMELFTLMVKPAFFLFAAAELVVDSF